MTSYSRQRCTHCHMPYSSLASGHPFSGTTNHTHRDYCETCWGAVVTALKAIPLKREKTWIEVTDPPVQFFINRREEKIRKARAEQESRRTGRTTSDDPVFPTPLRCTPDRGYTSFGGVDISKVITGEPIENIKPITSLPT